MNADQWTYIIGLDVLATYCGYLAFDSGIFACCIFAGVIGYCFLVDKAF